MFGHGKLAIRSTLTAGLAALSIAGPAGLAMLTAAPALASTRTPATTALASTRTAPSTTAPSAPATAKSYSTWKAAQRAAGFKLRKPGKTFGLVRKYPILVGVCQASGKKTKRDVYAGWQRTTTYLAIDQNDASGPCSNFGDARFLAHYRVQGHKASLYGFCGRSGMPSCKKKAITLVLLWRAGSNYYTAYSHNEWRATIVAFGRSLKRI